VLSRNPADGSRRGFPKSSAVKCFRRAISALLQAISHARVYWPVLLAIMFFILPRLLLKSPEKGCGKSTLVDLIGCLVNRPLLQVTQPHQGTADNPIGRNRRVLA